MSLPTRAPVSPLYDVVLVTRRDYPALFEAFEQISHDKGTQSGHTNYVVTGEWIEKLPDINERLNVLLKTSKDDFDSLNTGEESERQRIIKQYHLEEADKLLQEFYEEFT